MQKTFRWARLGALLFALRAITIAQTVPTVDELAEKHIAAMGGEEKMRAVQALKASGRLVVPGGVEFPLTLYTKRPGWKRLEMNAGGKTVIQAFDGSVTWSINPMTGSDEPKRGSEPELQRAREDAEGWFSDLLDYKAKHGTLEFAGSEEVRGRPAHKLKLTTRLGTVKYIYLDVETFLEIKTTTVRSRGGQEAGTVEYPSDYRRVEGVMVPFSVELEMDGQRPMKAAFDKVEINVAMDDALFQFPAASSASAPKKAPVAVPEGALRVRVTQSGYEPPRLEFPANQPVTIAFTREAPMACAGVVVFPSLNIRKELPLNETVVVSLPPQSAGEIRFSCGMGMFRGMAVAR